MSGSHGNQDCPVCGNPNAEFQYESNPYWKYHGCDHCGFFSYQRDSGSKFRKGNLELRVVMDEEGQEKSSMWWHFDGQDEPVCLGGDDIVMDVTSILRRFVPDDLLREYENRRDFDRDAPATQEEVDE